MIRFISTAPRLLNILALSSLVLLIFKIIELNDIKELFNGAYELGVILETILSSILASYIFYMVVVHLKEFKDRKYIYPLILKWTNIVVGCCITQLREIGEASNISIDLNNVTEQSLKTAFGKINPNNQAPLLLGFPGTYANWIQYMLYYKRRTKSNIEKIVSQILFIESKLFSKVLDVDDCLHFSRIEEVSAMPLKNTDISFMASSFYKYCVLCKELKGLIDVSKSKYG